MLAPCLALCLVLCLARPARSAETDPYYAWLHPPRDSTHALHAKLNEILDDALREVNRGWGWRRMSCPEVAQALVRPLRPTTMWFFVGAMDGYRLDYSPRSNTEYREEYAPRSIYREAGPWKWGLIVPPDPTLRIAGVNLSPDKLGHFFFEGWQYYTTYHAALEDGLSEREAHEKAIRHGIREETFIQGDVISGIFSYADLEANEQGLQFYLRLCDDEAPLLQKGPDGWRLTRELDLREYVNPCWDEAFYPSAFDEKISEGVRRAMREYCEVRERPDVEELFRRYRARGCSSFSYHYLEELAAKGEIPDRRPFTIDAVCAE